MATHIPPTGESQLITQENLTNGPEMLRVLGSQELVCTRTNDGVWVMAKSTLGRPINDRVCNWLTDRGVSLDVYGHVVWMSNAEATIAAWSWGLPMAKQEHPPLASAEKPAATRTKWGAKGQPPAPPVKAKTMSVDLPQLANLRKVQDQLTALGGAWDEGVGQWMVPIGKVEEASRVVSAGGL